MRNRTQPVTRERAQVERRTNLWQRSESFRGLVLVSPTFLYVLAMLVLPMAAIVVFSFWRQNFLDFDTSFTLANYEKAWTEPMYQVLMLRSVTVAGLVTAVTVIMAYPMAYFIAFKVHRHKALWLLIVTIPFWTSYLLRIFTWKIILGQSGVINSGLISLGLIEQPLSFLLYNLNAVILTLSHAWLAFAILPIYVSLQKIDRSLLEAATDLGDSRLARFVRVTLPLSMPGVIGAAVIIFIPTAGDYVTPRLVGGPDGMMISNAIQSQFSKANDWPLGSAIAVSSMLIITAFALIAAGTARRFSGRVA